MATTAGGQSGASIKLTRTLSVQTSMSVKLVRTVNTGIPQPSPAAVRPLSGQMLPRGVVKKQ